MRSTDALVFTIFLLVNCRGAWCQNDTLAFSASPWEEGHLDIHHIHTGRGDATCMVFPDGTTMLYDAGDQLRITHTFGPYQAKR